MTPTDADLKARDEILRRDAVVDVIAAQGTGPSGALQVAINRGQWGMEGSFGRSMMEAIESGACMLGSEATKDYYGNPIPGRYDVKPGSVGSPEYAQAYWARVNADPCDDCGWLDGNHDPAVDH